MARLIISILFIGLGVQMNAQSLLKLRQIERAPSQDYMIISDPNGIGVWTTKAGVLDSLGIYNTTWADSIWISGSTLHIVNVYGDTLKFTDTGTGSGYVTSWADTVWTSNDSLYLVSHFGDTIKYKPAGGGGGSGSTQDLTLKLDSLDIINDDGKGVAYQDLADSLSSRLSFADSLDKSNEYVRLLNGSTVLDSADTHWKNNGDDIYYQDDQVQIGKDQDGSGYDSSISDSFDLAVNGRMFLNDGQDNIVIGQEKTINYVAGSGANWNILLGIEDPFSGTNDYNFGAIRFALSGLTSGRDNIGIGVFAGAGITSGSRNIGLGNQAFWNVTGSVSDNIGIGLNAGSTITGNGNILFGANAGTGMGTGNVVAGNNAASAGSGDNNIYLGPEAGKNATGDLNIGIGNAVLNAVGFTGNRIIALGSSILTSITTASEGVYIGDQVAQGVTIGNFNTVIGIQAARNAGDIDFSTLIGYRSGYAMTGTIDTITTVGNFSLYNNTKNNVVGLGNFAGYDNIYRDVVIIGSGDGTTNPEAAQSGEIFIGNKGTHSRLRTDVPLFPDSTLLDSDGDAPNGSAIYMGTASGGTDWVDTTGMFGSGGSGSTQDLTLKLDSLDIINDDGKGVAYKDLADSLSSRLETTSWADTMYITNDSMVAISSYGDTVVHSGGVPIYALDAKDTLVISEVSITSNWTYEADEDLFIVDTGHFNISSGDTLHINSQIFVHPDRQIFEGAGEVWFGMGSIQKINVKWFGATGDGTTDDHAAIQKAIDVMINSPGVSTLYFPSGTYRITDNLIGFRDDDGDGNPEFWTGHFIGENDTYEDGQAFGAGVRILVDNDDGGGFLLERLKGGSIKNITLSGNNTFSKSTMEEVIEDAESTWVESGIRDNMWSPHAGIVIDPFGSSSQAGVDQYPGTSSYYNVIGTGGSSAVSIENVTILNFVVGILISPGNLTQNSDLIYINTAKVENCKDAVAVCHSQTKSVVLTNFQSFAPVHTILEGRDWGRGAGVVPEVIGANIGGKTKFFFNASGAYGEVKLSNIFGENIYAYGNVDGSNQGVSLINCYVRLFSDQAANVKQAPVHLRAKDTPVSFIGGTHRYYDGNDWTAPITFYTPKLSFHGTNLEAPAYNGFYDTGEPLQNVKYINTHISQMGNVWQMPESGGYFSHVDNGGANLNDKYISPGEVVQIDDVYQREAYQYGRDLLHVYAVEQKTITVDDANNEAWFLAADTGQYNIGDRLITISTVNDDYGSTFRPALGFVQRKGVSGDTIFIHGIPYNLATGSHWIYSYRFRKFKETTIGDITSASNQITGVITNTSNIESVWSVGDRIDNVSQFPEGTYIEDVDNGTKTITVSTSATGNCTDCDIKDGNIRQKAHYSAVPSTLWWNKGDIIYNTAPSSSAGWVCTKSGVFGSAVVPTFSEISLGSGGTTQDLSLEIDSLDIVNGDGAGVAYQDLADSLDQYLETTSWADTAWSSNDTLYLVSMYGDTIKYKPTAGGGSGADSLDKGGGNGNFIRLIEGTTVLDLEKGNEWNDSLIMMNSDTFGTSVLHADWNTTGLGISYLNSRNGISITLNNRAPQTFKVTNASSVPLFTAGLSGSYHYFDLEKSDLLMDGYLGNYPEIEDRSGSFGGRHAKLRNHGGDGLEWVEPAHEQQYATSSASTTTTGWTNIPLDNMSSSLSSSDFTVNTTTDRITYDRADTMIFTIYFHTSLDNTSSNFDQSFRIAKNGSIINGTLETIQIVQGSDKVDIQMSCIVEMINTDYIEFQLLDSKSTTVTFQERGYYLKAD